MLGHVCFELRTFRPTRRGPSNDMIALFSAPRASQTMPAGRGPFRTGMLGNSSLLSAVMESRETASWPGQHLSDSTLCWQRTAAQGFNPRSFCLLSGSSTSFWSPGTLMKEKLSTEIFSF